MSIKNEEKELLLRVSKKIGIPTEFLAVWRDTGHNDGQLTVRMLATYGQYHKNEIVG